MNDSAAPSNSSHVQLQKLNVPFALRHDNLANTYVDAEGALYIEPLATHDFELSRALTRDGFSCAQVVDIGGHNMLAFDKKTELVSLSAVISAWLTDGAESDDVERVLTLTTTFLAALHDKYGITPLLEGTDSVALNRWTGRIELLPPFTPGADTTVAEALDHLRDAAVTAMGSDNVHIDSLYTAFLDVSEKVGA
jgi:hypothetical protein